MAQSKEELYSLAQEQGFAQAYLLPVPTYDDWDRLKEQGLIAPQANYITSSPQNAYVWARGLLLMLWPYQPYKDYIPLSGYYAASQASYEAMLRVKKAIGLTGKRAEVAKVPFKNALLENGIGQRLHNDLLYIPPYGSRFLIQGLMVEQQGEKPLLPKIKPIDCSRCRRCESVCPGKAITERGYDFNACIRLYMEEDMPPYVMETMQTLLGCDLCQNVCPANSHIQARELNEAEKYAFDPVRLLQGEQKEALAIIGKNLKKGNKLIAQTAVLMAKAQRFDLLPLMENRLQSSTHEGEKQALQWAIDRLRKDEAKTHTTDKTE